MSQEDVFGMFGQVLSQYQKEMADSQEKFSSEMDKRNVDADKAMSTLVSTLANKGKAPVTEITPDIARIVSVCQQAPELTPVLLSIVNQYMADITAAVESVKAKYKPQAPPTNGDVQG